MSHLSKTGDPKLGFSELNLTLSEAELAFLHFGFLLFPSDESPLKIIENLELDAQSTQRAFENLVERKLWEPEHNGPSQELSMRLEAVSECEARIHLSGPKGSRSIYWTAEYGIEMNNHAGSYNFFPPQTTENLVEHIATSFSPRSQSRVPTLRMSAGDFLVFSVFAQNLRVETPEPTPDTMSLDEVLAFFDEPETPYVPTPKEEAWNESVQKLAHMGVLQTTGQDHRLNEQFEELAAQLSADEAWSISRVDYFEDQWLVREMSLYPTQQALYRLSNESDGTVLIEEVSEASLRKSLLRCLSTLRRKLES